MNKTSNIEKRTRLWLGLIALLGGGILMFYIKKFGIIFTGDSVYYISTARNLLDGLGFTTFLGTPLVVFPPLYPIVLALGGTILGIDPTSVPLYLNPILFSLVIYLTGSLALYIFQSFRAASIIEVLTATSIPLFSGVYTQAMSECLFVFFSLLSFIYGYHYFNGGRLSQLIIFSFAVSAALLTRYFGITLLVWGVLIILFSRGVLFPKKSIHLSLFIFISTLPIGLWCIRNYILTDTLTGERPLIHTSILQIIFEILPKINSWFIPGMSRISPWLSIAIGVSIVLTLIFLILFNERSALRFKSSHFESLFFMSYLIIYIVFFLAVVTRVATTYRLIVPIFIPLIFILVILMKSLIDGYKNYFPQHFRSVIIGIFSLWIIGHPLRCNLQVPPETGLLHKKRWANNQTLNYLKEQKFRFNHYSLYTNEPRVIYFMAGFNPKFPPIKNEKFWYLFLGKKEHLRLLSEQWPQEEKAILVWLNDVFISSGKEDLFSMAKLEEIAIFEDGAIYWVTPLHK